jgi:hypothetical protein
LATYNSYQKWKITASGRLAKFILMERLYIYRGDRMTDAKYKNKVCKAVLTPDGKCIRGRNGNMLVNFNNEIVVVLARQLRKS